MKTIASIVSSYVSKRKQYREKRDELEALFDKTQEKMNNLHCPSWIDLLIQPIAKEMGEYYAAKYEISGPFGIGARVVIAFKFGKKVKSITFEPGDLEKGRLYVVDYSSNSGRFTEGTIGEMNGFNYKTIEIPKDANIEWLAKWVK